VRFSVEAWAPEYGIAIDLDDLLEATESIDATVERALADWEPITPEPVVAPDRIVFVDGVRRIDARVWIHDGERPHAGICASVAAGRVACSRGRAEVSDVLVDRVVIASAHSPAGPVITRDATYEFVPTPTADPDDVYNAIHQRMTELEQRIAESECDLVVFDGPLRSRTDSRGVGYVKTQKVQHLPDEVVPVLGRLGDGDRTPLFLIGGGFTRWSWYVRLPGPRTHALSGIVRCELPGVGSAPDAIDRASEISALLPRFASAPHKEPRAPQNLYPIAGLEQALRRRLGDPLLLDRSLRLAAAAS
jgi:hypothetical protein